MREYVVWSGSGYVCEDRGSELPLMVTNCGGRHYQNGALRHSLDDAAKRLEMMDGHGLKASIELAFKEASKEE